MKILVYPKNQFPKAVLDNPTAVYISINDMNDSEHYLKNNNNVLNLNFNDTSDETGITDTIAESLLEFIEKHLGKDFIIHCTAGVSRSQAVGKFIREFYKEYENSITNKENPCITPNIGVYIMLKEAFYKKHGYPFESNKEIFLRKIKKDAGKFVTFNNESSINLLIGLLEDLEDFYWVSLSPNNRIIYTTGCCGYKITNKSFKKTTSDKDLRKLLDIDLDHWKLILNQNQNPEVNILYSII